jgi:hypothetical protein
MLGSALLTAEDLNFTEEEFDQLMDHFSEKEIDIT